ncbi:hypothetical protein GLYMA_03G048000v4 [Glycine max]|uniref:Uncharacterized protein n=1 Tax=Glycine max TaxID=3847 RepID=K7KCV1_SOYBN|nr:hypothetical protein GLYMA_03G048000v4 [Glycine max]
MKLLKKQHRQALLLDNFLGVDGLAPGHSLHDRKPVTYALGKKFYHSLYFVFIAGVGLFIFLIFFLFCMDYWSILDSSLFFAVDCCGYVRALGTFWGK